MDAEQNVTQALGAAARGDMQAFERLLGIIHGELEEIARRQEWQRQRNPTLNTGALVNELCIKWLENGLPTLDSLNRRTFYAAVARAIRGILIDHARRRRSKKRGGREPREAMPEEVARDGRRTEESSRGDPEAIAIALEKLRAHNPRQAEVVDLHKYDGLTFEQVGQLLDVTPKTVQRDWKEALAFLKQRLRISHE